MNREIEETELTIKEIRDEFILNPMFLKNVSKSDKDNLNDILEKIISVCPYYELELLLQKRISGIDVGHELTLKQLIQKYGFNNIRLDLGDGTSITGYEEADFKGYISKKVIIDSFDRDLDNFLIVQVKLK